MDKLIYTIILIFYILALDSISSNEIKAQHKEIMERLAIDPCQEIHNLKTVSSRDFKPQYNRKRIKQVVLECEEE